RLLVVERVLALVLAGRRRVGRRHGVLLRLRLRLRLRFQLSGILRRRALRGGFRLRRRPLGGARLEAAAEEQDRRGGNAAAGEASSWCVGLVHFSFTVLHQPPAAPHSFLPGAPTPTHIPSLRLDGRTRHCELPPPCSKDRHPARVGRPRSCATSWAT